MVEEVTSQQPENEQYLQTFFEDRPQVCSIQMASSTLDKIIDRAFCHCLIGHVLSESMLFAFESSLALVTETICISELPQHDINVDDNCICGLAELEEP